MYICVCIHLKYTYLSIYVICTVTVPKKKDGYLMPDLSSFRLSS